MVHEPGSWGGCRIYPEELANSRRQDPERRAEVLLYDELRRQLDATWTVFYDVPWLAPVGSETPRDGQTDFVVVNPTFGILLIEVKGGGIAFDARTQTWTSTGAQGKYAIDPINQVKDSQYALLKKLQSLPALDRKWINIFHAVAFPDCVVPKLTSFDAPPEILIGCDDMQYLKEKIEGIFRHWTKGQDAYPHGQLLQREVTELLAHSFELRNPLSVQTDRAEQEIVRLTEEQYHVLDQLNRNRRMVIGGCAGSGKTFLALEKARRLSREGYRTLLTCFNRPLAEHLRELTAGTDNLEVENFHSLCWKLGQKANIMLKTFERGADNSGLDEQYADALCLTMEALPELRYDAIIVDEGQDFKYDWWVALESSLRGTRPILYIFFDDNQTLYRGRGMLPNDMMDFYLTENIRNTKPIFDVVSRYYHNDDGLQMRAGGPSGRTVERFGYDTEDEMRRQVGKTLRQLVVAESIAKADLVVLTPKALDRSALLKTALPGSIKLARQDLLCEDEVLCSTIHSFKGLERKIVLVAELDEEMLRAHDADRARRCYVGFSRAKAHLAVFGKPEVLALLMPENEGTDPFILSRE